MSLNGLDSQDVQDAYQHAITEPGGWFLLHYASRDSIGLLGRGKGGVLEARQAIINYSDPSPLYGLLVYRRRKVLIKYIPDSTSRLLQARTFVHFQDVQQQFSPYETVLEITTAEGLNDTSLAAVFPLHTASPAVSTNKLDEIGEEVEDNDGTPAKQDTAEGSRSRSQRPRKDRRYDHMLRPERASAPGKGSPAGTPTSERPTSPLSTRTDAPSDSQSLPGDDLGQPTPTSAEVTSALMKTTSAPDNTQNETDSVLSAADEAETESLRTRGVTSPSSEHNEGSPSVRQLDVGPRHSVDTYATSEQYVPFDERPSLADRPSISERSKYDDDIDWSKFEPKPKVKLAPRPIAAGTKRPTVASIQSVPAGFRSTVKKQEPSRPKLTRPATAIASPTALSPDFPAPPPIPDSSAYSPRPLSRRSVKSLPSHKSTTMTPEKLRLLKAIELRKKQIRKSQTHLNIPQDDQIPDILDEPDVVEGASQEPQTEDVEQRGQANPDPMEELHCKSDSGIEMENEREDPPVEEKEAGGADDQEDIQDEAPITEKEAGSSAPSPEVPENTADVQETPISSDSLAPDEHAVVLSEAPKQPETYQPSRNEDFESADVDTLRPDVASVPTIVTPEAVEASPQEEVSTVHDSQRLQTDEPASGRESPSSPNTSDAKEDINPRKERSNLATRRRGMVAPMRIDTEAEVSSEEDDDDLVKELRDAEVQEARPVTVSKSPAVDQFPREFYPRRSSATPNKSERSVKSVANGVRQPTIPHDKFVDADPHQLSDSSYLSLSRTGPSSPVELYNQSAGKRRNVSSGISERIAALAVNSNRETSPDRPTSSPNAPSSDDNRATTPNQGSVNSRWPVRPRPTSYMIAARHSSNRRSLVQSPTVVTSPPPEAPATVTTRKNSGSAPDSVTVTARIVRPGGKEQASSPQDAGLRQSDVTVSRTQNPPPTTTTQTPPRDPSTDTSRPPSTSPDHSRTSTDMTRPLQSAKRKSFGGRHRNTTITSPVSTTSTNEDHLLPPTPKSRALSSASAASNEENVSPKDSSSTRTSRFFSRMSIIGGGKRKSPATPSTSIASGSDSASVIRSDSIDARRALPAEKSETPASVVLGDLNAQFPDTLLWKRRLASLTPDGHLLFTISQPLDHQKSSTRSFPLTDFLCPYVPDQDRQELPYSVVMEFREGGTTLQLACGDSATQRRVVGSLRAYWANWVKEEGSTATATM